MTKKEDKVRIGTLSFRVEDIYWNCYYQGAEERILLGSIVAAIVAHNKEVKDAFSALMYLVTDRIIREVIPEVDLINISDAEPDKRGMN